MKINMPVGNPPAQLKPPEVVRIEVDFDGSVTWNGTEIPDRASLEMRLRQIAGLPEQPEVHLLLPAV